MDTLEFFRAILPDEGVYFLALIDKNTGRVAHKSFATLEELTSGVAEFDKREDINVYHACASYKEPYIEVDGKKQYRKDNNWHKAKAFWIDLDCGQEKFDKGEGYLTKRLAAEAIDEFCVEHDFPKPMYVDSGNGVHCYWPLTTAIGPKSWRKIAEAFKAALAADGVLADPACTADFSRILRPVGAHNRKGEPKPVIGKGLVAPISPQEFGEKLAAIVSKLDIEVPKEKAPVEDINDDLTAHKETVNVPSSAVLAADHCLQMQKMRDTKGDVNYGTWFNTIGVIKSCIEGRDLAREWSENRAATGHNQVDWDIKYDTWSKGPTTCARFERDNPGVCEGCIHRGKVTSPIILGRIVPEPEAQNIEAIVDGEAVTVEVPPLPKGYKYENGQMARLMQDKDGIMHALVFCNDLFYPMNRIRKENGEFALSMRRHLPNGRTDDFQLDTVAVASPQDLVRGLCKYEVAPSNHKDANMHLTAYMRDSLAKLKTEAEELNTLTTFGWRDNMSAFLLGDRLYHKDGTVRKVLVGGSARTFASAFPTPQGTVEGYAHGLNYMYARPDMVMMQYAIASGFGSLLSPLGPTVYKGLLVALTGRKTGSGKTTACLSMLYALGDADSMKLATEEGATENGLNSMFSTYQNIPFLVDELTHISTKMLSRLSYRVSQGKDKLRMVGTKDGVKAAENASWQLAPYVTSNTDLHSLLAADSSDTSAEAVRVLMLNMDDYPPVKLDVNKVELAVKQMELNKGAAGDAFLKYVVPNLNDVMDKMQFWSDRFAAKIPEQELRFYRIHGACSLTAIEITNQLGITQFDAEALFDFAVKLIKNLANNVATQNKLTPEMALSDMIRDLSQRAIVTYEYRGVGDARGPEVPVKRISGVPAARYIIGSANSKSPELSGKMFVIRKEIDDWCRNKRMGFKELIDYAKSIGVLVPVKGKFTIGRGSTEKTGNSTCLAFDINKIENMTNADLKYTLASGGNASTEAKEAVS